MYFLALAGGNMGGWRDRPPDTAAELSKLREIDAFKTRFLNMAAHELNTPLTPLRLQLHMALAGQLGDVPPKVRHALEIADRSVHRINNLVREILEVARLQSGGLRFHVETFPVAPVVNEAIESFESTASTIGVDLRGAVPPDLRVKTDRDRLLQILLNLLSNGLKFTPAGGKVWVQARAERGSVVIEVTDTGMGLSKDQVGRLFQPFTQLHDPMEITSPGTGLGLYICRGLAEAMGGHLSASSPGPDQGSTFSLVLPQTHESLPKQVVPSIGRPDTQEDVARRIRELI